MDSMKSDLPDIPKIQPEKSVLVPESAKMVSEAESTKVASPVKSSPVPSAAPTIPLPNPPNPNPAKMNPWMKVGVIVSAVIIFLFMAIGIPAFLTYQKGMALYAASKKLSEAGKSQDLGKIKAN